MRTQVRMFEDEQEMWLKKKLESELLWYVYVNDRTVYKLITDFCLFKTLSHKLEMGSGVLDPNLKVCEEVC